MTPVQTSSLETSIPSISQINQSVDRWLQVKNDIAPALRENFASCIRLQAVETSGQIHRYMKQQMTTGEEFKDFFKRKVGEFEKSAGDIYHIYLNYEARKHLLPQRCLDFKKKVESLTPLSSNLEEVDCSLSGYLAAAGVRCYEETILGKAPRIDLEDSRTKEAFAKGLIDHLKKCREQESRLEKAPTPENPAVEIPNWIN